LTQSQQIFRLDSTVPSPQHSFPEEIKTHILYAETSVKLPHNAIFRL